METDYKILSNKDIIDQRILFDSDRTHFEVYDEETYKLKISRIEYLISNIPQIKSFITSPEYEENVKELTFLVSHTDLSIIKNKLQYFANYLMSITHENYYHNFDENESLFLLLEDLSLSFMNQDDDIIMIFFNSGFLNNVIFFLEYPHKTRKNEEILTALARALNDYMGMKRSLEIQKNILSRIGIQNFFIKATTDLYIDDESCLKLLYIIIALFDPHGLTPIEIKKCLKIFDYGLYKEIKIVYPIISIGLFKKIEKVNFSIFTKDMKNSIIRIYNRLLEIMKTEEDSDVLLCEYNFYISSILIQNKMKINIDYNDFQNYIIHDNQKVQIAAIYFFDQLSLNEEIIKNEGLDVSNFIKCLHEIYAESPYLVKEYLDKLIITYMNFVDFPDLFEMLSNGLTETLVQIIQTIQSKNGELFELLVYVNKIFEQSVELQCSKEFSDLFMELGGFESLQDFIDDPKYPLSIEKNKNIPEISQHIIKKYMPQES